MAWLGGQQPQQSACRVRLDRELRRWADTQPGSQGRAAFHPAWSSTTLRGNGCILEEVRMTTDPEAGAREWTAHVVRTKLARDANRISNEIERAASHAAAWLDDARTTEPALAGMRARLLSACVRAGAVAVGRAEEG
jgi:Tfp pilus assembly protein PilV